MTTRAEITITTIRRSGLVHACGDLVQFIAPENMSYIVMVTRDVLDEDDQFNGVTLTTNGLNLIGEYGNNYVTNQFTKFIGTIELTSE